MTFSPTGCSLAPATHKDLAYLVATQTTYPSWGYWQTLGATTLFEAWDSTARSNDHPFLGTVVDWFYQYLAGIKITGAGYSTISVMPYVPEGLTSAQAASRRPGARWRARGLTAPLNSRFL